MTMRYRCQPGKVFAPTSWDSQIGKTIPVRFGGPARDGRVEAAKVAPDGSWVDLTIEVDGVIPMMPDDLPPMSFGFRSPD